VQKKIKSMACTAFSGLLLFLLTSCASKLMVPTLPLELESTRTPYSVDRLTLSPGDEIEIKFYHTPDFNEIVKIRPDGNITLQRIDAIKAGGLTPEEVRAEIAKIYSQSGKLASPEIAVFVRNLARYRVYVGGEVTRPGMIDLDNDLTLLQAIIQAGGFVNLRSKVSQVIVIRRKDDKWYGTEIDMRNVVKGLESDNFYLRPMDIVYVSRKSIDKVNQWIEQYINRMLPRIGFASTAF